MLRLFFHRDSLVARLAGGVGFVLWLLWSHRLFFAATEVETFWRFLFLLFTAEVLFLTLCPRLPLYEKERGNLGLVIHFSKVRVVVRYLLFSAALCGFAADSFLLLLLALPVLTFLAYVNGALLFFHARDPGADPVNFFSETSRRKELNG